MLPHNPAPCAVMRRNALFLAGISALIYDAANPCFGDARVQRLRAREAAADEARKTACAPELALANERSRATRDHLMASFEEACALKNERRRRDNEK